MIEKFLDWRFENNVDDIRKEIVENNLTPNKFPGADIVMKHVKFMVISSKESSDPEYLASFPLTVEPFTSSQLFTEIDVEAYIRFRIYAMEYIAMVLEQISHEVCCSSIRYRANLFILISTLIKN